MAITSIQTLLFVQCNLNLDFLNTKTKSTTFFVDVFNGKVTLKSCNLGRAACTRIQLTTAP
jgi:hypothetical protein